MIKISKWFNSKVINEYANQIKKIFPYESIIFAKDSDDNDIKVDTYKLITLPKNELYESEPNAKLYFEIIKLINYRNENVSEYCSDKKIQTFCQKRKEWVGLFNSKYNIFIKQFIDKNPEYYKNKENFNKFINDIEDMLKKYLNKYLKKETDTSFYEYMPDELRHKIISSLDINVCPYCNRQYISAYFDDKDEKHTSADLDHFYPKSMFPLFSLSLFNFIPSCQICNHKKRAQFKNIVYPYEEEYGDDAVFTLKSDSDDYTKILKYLRGIESDDIYLTLNFKTDNDISEKIKNSKKMFGIESIYQNHLKTAMEIKFKQQIYDEGSYLSLLKEQFAELGFTQDELNIFLYGYSLKKEDDINRPLSKLIRDILNEDEF